MSESIKNKSRKEYFKQYYLKNKNKYKLKDNDNEDDENGRRRRGRPRKQIPKFSITKLDTPIIITFD
tara:strand:- start:259 stop:459 length:201 start_codon:yes stop_codon:yes gene_type:complete